MIMDINYDPNFASLPLSVDELHALLNMPTKKIAKERELVELILKRALATALALKNARIEFDNELRRRSAMLPATGGATSMANPELAVKYLPPEELAKLFDKLSQEKLDFLNSQIEKVQSERERSRRVLEEIAVLAYREGTPPDIAAELLRILKESREYNK